MLCIKKFHQRFNGNIIEMNENWNAKHDEREFEGKYTHSAQHTPGKRKNRHFHHYRHLLSTFDQKMSKRTQNYQVFLCVWCRSTKRKMETSNMQCNAYRSASWWQEESKRDGEEWEREKAGKTAKSTGMGRIKLVLWVFLGNISYFPYVLLSFFALLPIFIACTCGVTVWLRG